MFPYEFYEISKNTFFIEHLRWLHRVFVPQSSTTMEKHCCKLNEQYYEQAMHLCMCMLS